MILRKILSRLIVACNLKKFRHNGIVYDFSLVPKDFKHKILRGSYEIDEFNLLKYAVSRIKSDNIAIVELGSAIGYISMNIAMFDKRVRISSFELSKKNYEVAQHNLLLNPELKDRVKFYNIGISSSKGIVEYIDSNQLWSTSILITGEGVTSKERNLSFSTQTMTLTEVIKVHNPQILIVDIEGSEYEVFLECENFGSVDVLIVEIHGVGEETPLKKNQVLNRLFIQGFDIDFQRSIRNVLYFRRVRWKA